MTQLLSNWLQAHSSFGACISPDMAPCFCPSNKIPLQTQADFLPPTSTKINLLVKPKFYFFFKEWISQVIKGVCWAMGLGKESEREKEIKRGRKNRKAWGGQQKESDRKNQRQKETETRRDITLLFNIISHWSGDPPQWGSLEMWSSQ